MFTENEMASALREIRARDPRFDMVLFLRRLKKDVPVIIKGSLDGNALLLKEHCAPEMVERFTGIFAAQQAQARTPNDGVPPASIAASGLHSEQSTFWLCAFL